ncbi:hypothetical protein EVAR_89287_1 [Eumeta japonica]|uniref:Uncharacterized protein n=1 Tax=Eumeta variegata TaxID=151549 RepID=A0A4C1YUM0_EUMVA|nr:hypothetical protein EVAR_89287_1 [Eumeta japonica]
MEGKKRERVSYWNFHSLDEMQQHKLLLQCKFATDRGYAKWITSQPRGALCGWPPSPPTTPIQYVLISYNRVRSPTVVTLLSRVERRAQREVFAGREGDA